jgi:probable F420-dependent oxidoreductase
MYRTEGESVSDAKPIRFSIQIPDAADARAWADKARRADDLGFYSISVPDHLGPSLPQLAPLVALASAAAVTSRLRLAVTVLDNDFRHPVMLAKEIATLDVLSSGRVDMGLGAGWLEEDYTRTGVTTWDPPATRVDRLFESVSVLRLLFSGEPVTFPGMHYQVTEFRSHPSPVQNPVPLMIGGRGPRMLSFAAREAQIVSVLAATGEGGNRLAGFERQLRWISEAGGASRSDLLLGIRIPFGELVASGSSPLAAAERFGSRFGMTASEVLASPFLLVGDRSGIHDHLVEIAERFGISYVTVSEDLAWQISPIIEGLSG